MSWSYNAGDLASSEKDQVRFRVGDTNRDDPLLQDEEIQFLLDEPAGVLQAAVVACETIAANFSRLVDQTTGKVRVSHSQKSKQYMEMADKLRRRIAVEGGVMPFAGGISKAQKKATRQDSDRTHPYFERDQMDFPGTDSLGRQHDRED